MTNRLLAGLLGALASFAVTPAPAVTWLVPGDAATIADAVGLAATGDTVLVSCGTYLEHDIFLPRGITIRSETGDPDCVTIDASSLGRVFYSEDTIGDVRIEGVTVTGGLVSSPAGTDGWGGGMLLIGGSPALVDCAFVGNTAFGGGGLAIGGHDSSTVTRCTFSDNSALEGGGALCTVGTFAFTDCTFSGNTADSLGGGISSTFSTVILTGSTFHGNSATEGGALCGALSNTFTVERTILAFSLSGEAVLADDTSVAALACCDVFGNAGGDWVGVIAGQNGIGGNFSADPLFCDAAAGNFGLQSGSPCRPGNHPDGVDCGVIGAHAEGCSVVGLPDDLPIARGRALDVRPNPFRDSVRLAWHVPAPAGARLAVFDVGGRLLRTFEVSGTSGVARWDGTSATGEAVAAGSYFVRLETDAGAETRRVLFLR